MLPLYNSFPHQLQTSVPPPRQNSMPSQPQMGKNNPQIPVPFNGVTQPAFLNGPNHLLPFQNNHLGMPHLGSLGPPMPQQGNPHLGNMNSVSAFPVRGQAVFGQNNLPNLPQFNQNMALPFGQFCMPNPLQNMNQLVPMQLPNLSQFCPQSAFGVLNQAPQAVALQSPGFNPQFGNMHQYNQIAQQVSQTQHNSSLPAATPLLQSNPSTTVSNSFQTDKNIDLQPSVFMGTQGNPTKPAGANNPSSSWKNQSSNNFRRNPKGGMMQARFQNSQFRHVKNGKKKFGFPNANKGRGLSNEKSGKFGNANTVTQGREKRRSLSIMYTAQEIQQWREERRKNYPSRGNVEKKLAEKLADKESSEREAKIRHEQLKEILAKQAELGVEVAEIPGYSLSDPKKQRQGREENGKSSTKKGKLHNKFDKRGRNNKKERYSKRQRLNENGSSTAPFLSMRKPTLLKKLVGADIKRDKSRLLQAFRFMVLNSFFKDWPDKPLKFPSVIVKEGSGEDVNDIVGNMHRFVSKVDLEHSDNTVMEKIDGNDHVDDDIDNGNDDGRGEGDNKISDDSDNDEQENEEEEEGEIIN